MVGQRAFPVELLPTEITFKLLFTRVGQRVCGEAGSVGEQSLAVIAFIGFVFMLQHVTKYVTHRSVAFSAVFADKFLLSHPIMRFPVNWSITC